MKTVITYGVFDLFHDGHRSLLERARSLGDKLIVGVTTDQYAYQRGKMCLVDSIEKRIENVKKSGFADEIIIEDHHGQKVEDINRYNVDIFAIGDDWLGKFEYLEDICQVIYLKRTPDISSTLLRYHKYPFLKIGIIGSGRVAVRFMREAGYIREIQVPCVYNPHLDNSDSLRRFLESHTSVMKVRTLEKLFDQTDAVYIASPHETHYGYAKAALMAGKHVLCEKPLSFNKEEAQELFEIAESNGLVLMEGIKTAYCPGFVKLISVAKSGLIGDIVNIESCFTRLTPPGLREWTDLKYGGSFTELGSYILLPIVKLLGINNLEWNFKSILNDDGLDIFTKLEVSKEDIIAAGRCGIGAKSEGQLIISGTKGYILTEAPWWKTTYFEIRGEDPNYKKRFTADFEGDGMRYEIADLLYRVQGHEGREFKLTKEESICMAEVFSAFLKGRSDNAL